MSTIPKAEESPRRSTALSRRNTWQGLTRLLAVYNGSNSLLMRFQYADGRMPVTMTKGSTTYRLAYDQVGSLRLVTDSNGNTVKQIEYDSFGNILTDNSPTFTVPFGFAGGLHDRDISLVRFGFRDYDPETGRWTAKDPIGFKGGDVDVFGYVLGNPVSFIDPNGENPLLIGAAIAFGGYTLYKAVNAWDKFMEDANKFGDKEKERLKAWEEGDAEGFCDAQSGRGLAAQNAGLSGALVLKEVPGTMVSGPLSTGPLDYAVDVIADPVVDAMFEHALSK